MIIRYWREIRIDTIKGLREKFNLSDKMRFMRYEVDERDNGLSPPRFIEDIVDHVPLISSVINQIVGDVSIKRIHYQTTGSRYILHGTCKVDTKDNKGLHNTYELHFFNGDIYGRMTIT